MHHLSDLAVVPCRRTQHTEVEKLAKFPSADVVHAQMITKMMPGSSLRVPNVAAYLVTVLNAHVESQKAAETGSSDS